MKVIKPEVRQLQPGNAFLWDGELFLVLAESDTEILKAANLETGAVETFENNQTLQRVAATVTID